MKVIVDIPDKDAATVLTELVAKGCNITNLPEAYGRLMLIDIDELPFFRCPNNVNKCPPSYDFTCQNCDYGITSRFRIERMGTLIESKKEKENE